MFQFLGLVALGYLSLKLMMRPPVDPEPLDMDDYEFDCEIENDLVVGRILRALASTSSDSESQQSDDNDDETSESQPSDNETSEKDDDESSYEIVESEKPQDEEATQPGTKQQDSDNEGQQQQDSEDEQQQQDSDDEGQQQQDSEDDEQQQDSEDDEQQQDSGDSEEEEDRDVVWETVKGQGLHAFWADVRKDLTPRELDVARLVMRRLRRNLNWGCLDTLWWVVLGRDAPMDLLTPKICSARVRMRFYAPWVIQYGDDYAPSELEFTRSIRHWTR